MKEIVQMKNIKLLKAGIIQPIFDSKWLSLVHVVPKKGTMVLKLENNELIPTRTVMGWHMCIDYKKLNKATHIPFSSLTKFLRG